MEKIYKKRFIILIVMMFTATMVASVFTFIVDPYFHYHKPIKYLDYPLHSEIYQNNGIVKNFDYDALITGSSMTELFKPSQFDKLFGSKTIKVPYSGGKSKELAGIVQAASDNQPNLNKVFWGLDLDALESDPNVTRFPMPEYLLDSNPFNDLNYLLNGQVIKKDIFDKILLADKTKYDYNFDDYMDWGRSNKFGEYQTLKGFKATKRDKNKDPKDSKFMTLTDQNLRLNILPVIEDNPDIEFNFILPPYSILFWSNRDSAGILDGTLERLEYALTTLNTYENVKIHYFQNDENIVLNLNNYKDYTHYGPEINEMMADSIYKGSHLIEKGKEYLKIESLKNLVSNFDYKHTYGDKKFPSDLHQFLDDSVKAEFDYLIFGNISEIEKLDKLSKKLLGEIIDISLINQNKKCIYLVTKNQSTSVKTDCLVEDTIEDLTISQENYIVRYTLDETDEIRILINGSDFTPLVEGLSLITINKKDGRVYRTATIQDGYINYK